MLEPIASNPRPLTIGLCATVVAIAFETIAVATAMPVAAQDLDGLRWYAWVFSAFLIGMLFATVVGGRLSDRLGPAKPLIAGLASFTVGLLISGTATTMAQLIVGRLVQGVGSGVMNVAIFVCIARAFPPDRRPRMFTFISTAWVLPSFVGPPVAAWLTRQLSWHWVFFAVLPLVAVGAVLVLPIVLRLPATRNPPSAAAPAAIWAAAVTAAGAGLLQLAGQRLNIVGAGLAAAGLVALAVSLPRLMPTGFARFRRGLPMVVLTRSLLPGAFVSAEAFVPLMLVEQRHVPLVVAGAVLTVGSVGWTAGSYLQSRPWLRVRRDRLITAGCLSVAVGVAGVAGVAVVPSLWYGLVAVGWIFAGLGMGLATSSTALATMSLSGSTEQGRNASSLNVGDALGSGLFVGVSGSIFAALHPGGDLAVTFGLLLGVMSAVGLAAAAASLRIGPVRNDVT